MSFYFKKFENRRPLEPVPYSFWRETLWQFLATINLVFGGWYIYWRWTASLNWDAPWFSLTLVIAETLAYIGLIFFTHNLWQDQPYKIPNPPKHINDCLADPQSEPQRPIRVDVFITTYSEDPELVRLSIRDSRNITYPYPIDMTVHILDDGRRPIMRQVAEEEGANYITRSNNIGFKAGNMRNAMEQTHGDFIVICDADTRPFPTLLAHTLGYFCDAKMAWVQTPQWFYDLPEGIPLKLWLKKWLSWPGYALGTIIEAVFGEIRMGYDPFVNDPQMFYDVILRRRNHANAAFCCGAGSIHRREAVMEV